MVEVFQGELQESKNGECIFALLVDMFIIFPLYEWDQDIQEIFKRYSELQFAWQVRKVSLAKQEIHPVQVRAKDDKDADNGNSYLAKFNAL